MAAAAASSLHPFAEALKSWVLQKAEGRPPVDPVKSRAFKNLDKRTKEIALAIFLHLSQELEKPSALSIAGRAVMALQKPLETLSLEAILSQELPLFCTAYETRRWKCPKFVTYLESPTEKTPRYAFTSTVRLTDEEKFSEENLRFGYHLCEAIDNWKGSFNDLWEHYRKKPLSKEQLALLDEVMEGTIWAQEQEKCGDQEVKSGKKRSYIDALYPHFYQSSPAGHILTPFLDESCAVSLAIAREGVATGSEAFTREEINRLRAPLAAFSRRKPWDEYAFASNCLRGVMELLPVDGAAALTRLFHLGKFSPAIAYAIGEEMLTEEEQALLNPSEFRAKFFPHIEESAAPERDPATAAAAAAAAAEAFLAEEAAEKAVGRVRKVRTPPAAASGGGGGGGAGGAVALTALPRSGESTAACGGAGAGAVAHPMTPPSAALSVPKEALDILGLKYRDARRTSVATLVLADRIHRWFLDPRGALAAQGYLSKPLHHQNEAILRHSFSKGTLPVFFMQEYAITKMWETAAKRLDPVHELIGYINGRPYLLQLCISSDDGAAYHFYAKPIKTLASLLKDKVWGETEEEFNDLVKETDLLAALDSTRPTEPSISFLPSGDLIVEEPGKPTIRVLLKQAYRL